METDKDYNFRVHTKINKALDTHNKTLPAIRFTTVDALILNLAKSFYDSRTSFFMSNKELGELTIADESTVQRSVNKLIKMNLITKDKRYSGQKPVRVLTYNPDAVNELLNVK